MEQNTRQDGLPLIIVTNKESLDNAGECEGVVEDDDPDHLAVHRGHVVRSMLNLIANRSHQPSSFSKNRENH